MDQKFLYHGVPKTMQGTILYPLNQLKDIYPEEYSKQVKKYDGRPKLLTATIPILNCLWNDVVHLTAVHPEKINELLRIAGFNPPVSEYFQIPLSALADKKAVAYLYKSMGVVNDPTMYEVFSPANIDKYDSVPNETFEYYLERKKAGMLPLVYHRVPHILVEDTLDTSNFIRIKV